MRSSPWVVGNVVSEYRFVIFFSAVDVGVRTATACGRRQATPIFNGHPEDWAGPQKTPCN
jgi:hypothetical protein